jgi:acetyl esterase/lipase
LTSGEAAREERRRGGLLPQPLPVSELAEDRVVAGVPVRVFTPPDAGGLYLHLHGGGFVYGSSRLQDDVLERIALACGVEVVSVEYRLAPEHPYPAAPDDCEAVAVALAEQESRPLAIGGESAGANLAVTTLRRLRDRHGAVGFTAAALAFGVYDLALSQFTDERDPSLTREELTRLVADYAAGAPLDDADLSPARADLHGLPDALFVVGSRDPLLHDSSLMARRWREAGSRARLTVVPGAQHGLDASEHVNAFLRGRLVPG